MSGMNHKLGAAVIGARMGAAHARAYRSHPHVALRAVCDLDLEAGQKLASEVGADLCTTDYRDLLRRDDIHLVSVATPDAWHAEQTIAALEAGKHVLCEKPMAPTVAECEQMIAAAVRSDRKLMVGQVCRFTPGFTLARRLVASGRIGELYFVESEYAHDYARAPGIGGWRKDPVRKREPFLGGGCHSVDLLRWVAGEMESCFALANHKCLPDWPVDDCTAALYRFKSGANGKVLSAIGCKRPYTMRSVFWGTRGTLICDNTSPSIQLATDEYPEVREFTTLPVPVNNHNVGAEVGHFIAAVRGEALLECDGREGARTVAACLAAVESAGTGVVVSVRSDF
jgi:predicted dehydrogenase